MYLDAPQKNLFTSHAAAFFAGSPEASSSSGASAFTLSVAERCLSSQARFVVYCAQSISLRTVEDPFFKEMLRMHGGPTTAILTSRMLRKYIMAEFAIFVVFVQLMMNLKLIQSYGSPFGQNIHDVGTLANKKKYAAIGLQFIDPRWLCNIVICLGFVLMVSTTADVTADMLDRTFVTRTGYSLLAICGIMVSDRAALAVSAAAGMKEKEACEMHDWDKVGQSATGQLTRSRAKVVINPFPEGVELMSLFHKMATHFSYGSRRAELRQAGASLGPGVAPDITVKVDLNGTRVAAPHGLLLSSIRMNRALRLYSIHHPEAFVVSVDDWKTCAEFEAVLNISQLTTELAQKENAFVAAIFPLIKQLVYARLTASTIDVIALDDVTADPRLKRTQVLP